MAPTQEEGELEEEMEILNSDTALGEKMEAQEGAGSFYESVA